jgi:hypothetical protein
MSNLCKLKSKSFGELGLWANSEICRLKDEVVSFKSKCACLQKQLDMDTKRFKEIQEAAFKIEAECDRWREEVKDGEALKLLVEVVRNGFYWELFSTQVSKGAGYGISIADPKTRNFDYPLSEDPNVITCFGATISEVINDAVSKLSKNALACKYSKYIRV